MGTLQITAIWTAVLSSLFWTGLSCALLSGNGKHLYLVIPVAGAVALVVAPLLCGALIACLIAWLRRSKRHRPQPASPLVKIEDDQAYPAEYRKRQEALRARLDVDEPHLCSQHRVACTCWSLCGGAPERNSDTDTTPSVQTKVIDTRNLSVKAGEKAMPVVHRQGRDDCPFRYASALMTAPRAGNDLSAASPGRET